MDILEIIQMGGQYGGLLLAIYICYQFMTRFEKTTERLIGAFEQEVKACEERYNIVMTELLKLKERN